MNSRQTIRQAIRLKRQQLSPTICLQASVEICHYIANTPWFLRSRRIAFYYAVRGEIDPRYLMQRAWQMHKNCYLPVCHPVQHQSLLFVPYRRHDLLKPNRYHILEPNLKAHTPCKPLALDLVFVPLVAFDQQGNRLGSGKGYYDRTFAYLQRLSGQTRPLLVGLAYQFQAVKQIPTQPWDIPLDEVIVADYP